MPFEVKHLGVNLRNHALRKYCPAQDLADSEKVSPAFGVTGSWGDGTPIGKGFLTYPQSVKFGVTVSAGNIGE